ncbi:MAG: cohesin domain-containing protein [Patescibacteria group bacterium]
MTLICKKLIYFVVLLFFSISTLTPIYAQNININASKLLHHSSVFFSPRSGSFEEESTFQVPILVNTMGRSINGIEIRVLFDKDKLSIVNQTGGVSIIGVWVEPPKYDNTRGTASYVGVIPNGIITEAGLVGTITFKAKSAGQAVVSIANNSKILLNDGLGTETILDLGRASYSILNKAPGGVQVFSETHPISSEWYNNNTPVFSWIQDAGVSGFSFELDNKPNTIPDNTIDILDTVKSFNELNDGLWYFHVKAIKDNVWGTTGHLLIRIDTTPPAEFTPETNFLLAATILAERTLISFFTTDNLSGIDHYEVGVIDKLAPLTESPVFIEAESPFQVPINSGGKLEVIVRAVDRAGNVRDSSVNVEVPFIITKFIKDYIVYILLSIILLGFTMLVIHYLVGHHIIRAIRRTREILNNKNIENTEDF